MTLGVFYDYAGNVHVFTPSVHAVVTADISDIIVDQSRITDTEAFFTIKTNSTFANITEENLYLSSSSGGGGDCTVVTQTAQSISVSCTDLSNETAYSLTIIVSVGDNPDVMVIINFETPATPPTDPPTTHEPSMYIAIWIHRLTKYVCGVVVLVLWIAYKYICESMYSRCLLAVK